MLRENKVLREDMGIRVDLGVRDLHMGLAVHSQVWGREGGLGY